MLTQLYEVLTLSNHRSECDMPLSAETTVLRPFSVLLVLVRRHAGHLAWVVPCSKRKVRGIPPGYGSCD
jgi:hypothetical protein